MRDVGQEQADLIAFAYPLVLQALRHTPHCVRHIGIAIFAPHEVGQCRSAHPLRRFKKHIVQR